MGLGRIAPYDHDGGEPKDAIPPDCMISHITTLVTVESYLALSWPNAGQIPRLLWYILQSAALAEFSSTPKSPIIQSEYMLYTSSTIQLVAKLLNA